MWSGIGAAAIGGGLSVGGSILGSILNANFAEDAASTAYGRQLAMLGLQQAYSTRMANTAHQREVKDLRSAGLNPILSATGGNGAMSPVVSPSSVAQASGVDFGDLGLGKAGELVGKSSAFSLAKKQAEQAEKNSESQRELNQANASSARAQASLLEEQEKKVREEKDLIRAQKDDTERTHLYKMPGRLLNYIQQKYRLNSAKSYRLELDKNGKAKSTLIKDGFRVIPLGEFDKNGNSLSRREYSAGGF